VRAKPPLAELASAIEDACRGVRNGEAQSLSERLDATFEDAVTRLEALCPARGASASHGAVF